VKCSMSEIDAGNAAVTAERDRLQLASTRRNRAAQRDPFLLEPPEPPPPPGRVEMLVEGLREVEMEGE